MLCYDVVEMKGNMDYYFLFLKFAVLVVFV